MGTDNEQEYEIDLKEIAIVILDRIWIVISVGIACALLAGIITKVFITPMYTSTTKLYVINKQNSENNITYTDLQTGNLLTNDYIIQVKGTKVLSQVISELNLTDTEDELASRITVSNPENSRFIVISVSDKDPVVAQQIASCVAEVSSDVVKEVMDLEKVNVAEEANLPLEKSSPNLKKNVLLGGAAGVFVSLLLIVVFYLLNDRIRTPEDVKRYLGLNTLGQIPVLENSGNTKRKQRHKKPGVDDEDDDEDENEQEPVAAVPAVADAGKKQDEIPVFVPGLSVETDKTMEGDTETVSYAEIEDVSNEAYEDETTIPEEAANPETVVSEEAANPETVVSEETANPEYVVSEESVKHETVTSEDAVKPAKKKKSDNSKKKSKDKEKKADKSEKEDKEDKPVKDKKSKKKKPGKKTHHKKDHDKNETEYAEGGEDNE
ncbi:MAG: Wzz/FepE/Etk N-terminal domain-containing protein [Coprococcus sp.]|nr:Wzz/FepE/Etk N-terminal domain-containing protein [Coprococcus sp.]